MHRARRDRKSQCMRVTREEEALSRKREVWKYEEKKEEKEKEPNDSAVEWEMTWTFLQIKTRRHSLEHRYAARDESKKKRRVCVYMYVYMYIPEVDESDNNSLLSNVELGMLIDRRLTNSQVYGLICSRLFVADSKNTI